MKLIVPTSLKDITLLQYQNYQKEIDSSANRPDQAEYLNIKKIEIFCKITQDEVYNIQLCDVYSISEKIDYIAKDQNLNHLIQDIVSICPSMNQK